MKRSDVSYSEDSGSETSLGMLSHARRGVDNAWDRLVDRYSRRVYRWCRCQGLQPADASNVTQEVFRSVARNLGTFERRHGEGSFRGWVHTITRNKIRDHFRRLGRHPDVGIGGTDAHLQLRNLADPECNEMAEPPHLGPQRHLRLEQLERVRAEFSARDWRFFWRLVVDGQTAREVADEHGVTCNAVRLVKMRVLRRLREALNVNRVDPPT